MERKMIIKLIVLVMAVISICIPWEDDFLDADNWDYIPYYGMAKTLGFLALLFLGLGISMLFIREISMYSHWISLIPFTLCVLDFVTYEYGGNQSGIYIALILTLTNAVVHWKYRVSTSKNISQNN